MATQYSQVDRQFGPQAAAYLTSNVHANGEDLKRAASRFEGQSSARVLDLGCGAGHLSFAIAPHVREVIACDLSPNMLAVVADAAVTRGFTNIRTQECPAERLPFADASVDAVCTRFSAHHWSDVAKAMKEARRVLKPGGKLIVIDTCAADSALLDTHMQTVELLRDVSHCRNYSAKQWREFIAEAGFRLDQHDAWTLRMQFDEWIARMRTPADRASVIKGLLHGAPEEVRRHFNVEPDGSFTIDVMSFEGTATPIV
jgi:ubiquinone/menaquinone biosynthesis C-methylase UbiE